ncbi:MAG: hypothetical protein Q8L57_02745, partial [bacterium]|nr:hypothetical protein [bacterium]
MNAPNFQKEKSLAKKGYKVIIGVDEAGRGPLAGPITAAALAVIDPISNFKPAPYRNKVSGSGFLISKQASQLYGIKDSKKLSPRQRERWYKILTSNPQIRWAAASVGPRTIDKINIARAAKLAAGRAFRKLIAKIFKRSARRQKLFVLLDGSLYLPKNSGFLNSQTII